MTRCPRCGHWEDAAGVCSSVACVADRDTRQAFVEAQRLIAGTTLDAAVQAKAIESKLLELAGVLELREKEVAALRRELEHARLVITSQNRAHMPPARDPYDKLRRWDWYFAAAVAGVMMRSARGHDDDPRFPAGDAQDLAAMLKEARDVADRLIDGEGLGRENET